jgi:nitrogen fixation protein FixH
MKFNWGTGIFLFYTIFAISLFYQVYVSTKYSNDLVEENYYEKDLAYQSRFERIQNSQALSQPMEINYMADQKRVDLIFPAGENQPTGNVRLYRADDEKKDLRIPVEIDEEGRMPLNAKKLTPGMWKVEVEWDMDGTEFFNTKTIFIPKA